MADRTLHFTWRWDMPAPPERVWPLVADTHSFNRAAGEGPWDFEEAPDPEGGSIRTGSLRVLGVEITWDEHPFQWSEPRDFSILRVFHNGPFRQVLSRLDLEPTEAGCTLTYSIEAQPRSIFWDPVVRYYIGVHTRQRFSRVFGDLARYLAEGSEAAYPQSPPALDDAAAARLENAQVSLTAAGYSPAVARHLTRHIQEASDDDCQRIKPYALADRWAIDRVDLLKACLHATRIGLLELSWDIMCPLCRGAKAQTSKLTDLRSQAHCSSCNIQFDANFDRSVEVTFRPTRQIRRVQVNSYCVGGPGNTTHIMTQRSVPPGEKLSFVLDLPVGVYRLRGPHLSSSALLDVAPSHPALDTIDVTFGREDLLPPRIDLAPGSIELGLQNQDQSELLIVLERMEWPDNAVTAAQVSALQDFRDLFSSEVLDPEEQFQVRYLTFMFTDLRASTVLYREKGDAPAYALVRDHFQILQDCVARRRGAVVKTIGDAVMAVFSEPGNAVEAAHDIHRAFRGEAGGHLGLVLKMGVHAGPCMAVNLNGRLDYFGTTVNTAVRLEAISQGSDLVMLAELLEDLAVRRALDSPGVHVDRFEAELKGFDEAFQISRVTWGPQ